MGSCDAGLTMSLPPCSFCYAHPTTEPVDLNPIIFPSCCRLRATTRWQRSRTLTRPIPTSTWRGWYPYAARHNVPQVCLLPPNVVTHPWSALGDALGCIESVHTHAHTHTHAHAHARTLTHTHTHTHRLAHTHTYIHTNTTPKWKVHTHTHIHMHTHSHISHTHTRTSTLRTQLPGGRCPAVSCGGGMRALSWPTCSCCTLTRTCRCVPSRGEGTSINIRINAHSTNSIE